ncbi:hypothetical protein BVY01_04505 [bacterium I07]|nr:hypothetical protein BVY01_04505 [bacterium I07]
MCELSPMRQICIAWLIILLFTTYPINLWAENRIGLSVKGKVTDSKTGKPIPDVNVYLSGTTYGSATDKDGRYIIEFILPGTHILVASHIGYFLQTLEVECYKAQEYKFDFMLKPRVLQTTGIGISAPHANEWKKHLKTFSRLFLGESDNAKDCKMLNPEVLEFDVDEQSGNFVAKSDSILRLENQSLGYKVYIVIESFLWIKNLNRLQYMVYPRFETMRDQNRNVHKKWIKRRRQTFRGSYRHFLKSLVQNRLVDDGFDLFPIVDTFVEPEYVSGLHFRNYFKRFISADTLGMRRLRFKDYLYVVYRGRRDPIKSYLKLAGHVESVIIDTLGNCHTPFGLEKSGDWGNARIADELPLDWIER